MTRQRQCEQPLSVNKGAFACANSVPNPRVSLGRATRRTSGDNFGLVCRLLAIAGSPAQKLLGARKIPSLIRRQPGVKGLKAGRRVRQIRSPEGFIYIQALGLARHTDLAPTPPQDILSLRAQAARHFTEQIVGVALAARLLQPGRQIDAVSQDRVGDAGARPEGADQAIGRGGAADLHAVEVRIVQFLQRFRGVQTRLHHAIGILGRIAFGQRPSAKTHHGVANELVDDQVVFGQFVDHRVHDLLQMGGKRFQVLAEFLAGLGKAVNIHEKDRAGHAVFFSVSTRFQDRNTRPLAGVKRSGGTPATVQKKHPAFDRTERRG